MDDLARPGGVRQRAKRTRVQKQRVPSSLARFLVRQVAQGQISPQLCQRVAALAKDDMQKLQDSANGELYELDQLVSISSPNESPRNVANSFSKSLHIAISPSTL